MGNVFDTPEMAAAYAKARPAVHPRVIERARPHLPMPLPVPKALDVGCGAGLSSQAILPLARQIIGIDPSETMIQCASQRAPGIEFRVGSAEALPLAPASVDLITAAGSLNYADLDTFFVEAGRVLTSRGAVLVYDFSPGKSLVGNPVLDEWFAQFLQRYPMPAGSAQELNPKVLGKLGSGFALGPHEHFEVDLTLAFDFYVDYVLSETNVAHAIELGVPDAQIRQWCADTLRPIFGAEPKQVLFRGYWAVMTPRGQV